MRLTGTNNDYCFFTCYENEDSKIREDCQLYNVCYERQMYEKLKHYEELEAEGRLVFLSKEFNKEYLISVLSSQECVVHFGVEEPENCNGTNCENCWKAALKGAE